MSKTDVLHVHLFPCTFHSFASCLDACVLFLFFFIKYESYCHITAAAQTLPIYPLCIYGFTLYLNAPLLTVWAVIVFCCTGCESLWVSELFSAEQKQTGKAICAVFSLTACGRTVRGKRQEKKERAAVRSGRTETGGKKTIQKTLPPVRKK